MMIYANQYVFEDGSHHFYFYESEEERDFHFSEYRGSDLIRRRNFKEVDLNEHDTQSTPND